MIPFFSKHILSWLVFFPLFAAFLLFWVPKNATKTVRWFSLLASLFPFFLSIFLFQEFNSLDPYKSRIVLNEVYPWIQKWNIFYRLNLDGVSLLLVLLTTLTIPVVILFSFGSIREREKQYYLFLLMLETAMLGAFLASDLFLFYVFWEAMLIPMYFLIGIWGGKRRIYAAVKFFIYTMIGSVLMLAAILYLYLKTGSFHYQDLLHHPQFSSNIEFLLFAAFALSFAIKVPMFPLHTWLPDAHVEAPTAGSVILAGILLKMGTYGFFRFAMPLFPNAFMEARPLLITLSVIGIVYGALVSIVQTDIKKLIAYSSVSHLGFVMLGLVSLDQTAVTGAVYQMLNHGVSTGALFLLVGMLYDRRHSREISDFGGIAKVMPVYTVLFLIVTFSSIALPMTNGFIGEFLILTGSFSSFPWHTIVASTGVIFAAVYMLWMVQRVFFGSLGNPENKTLKDLGARELLVLAPFIILIFWMGLYPQFFFEKMQISIRVFLEYLKK